MNVKLKMIFCSHKWYKIVVNSHPPMIFDYCPKCELVKAREDYRDEAEEFFKGFKGNGWFYNA